MAKPLRTAFEALIRVLPVSSLLPLKHVTPAVKASSKYLQIVASMKAVGIIEPLVVARSKNQPRHYLLLDGHLRHAVLIDDGAEEVRCLLAKDDEAFTYNKRISRLATVQEHLMIVRAIDRGVSEERLALALNLDVSAIRRRRLLLVDISVEAVELLRDKSVNRATFDVLRKMRPMRQVEAAELMNTAGNYTLSYAKALLAATPQAELKHSDQPKKVAGLTAEQMARMEREMEALQQGMKGVEARYGDDILHLVIASGYVTKLVANKAIHRYLEKHHSDLLSELKPIILAGSMENLSN